MTDTLEKLCTILERDYALSPDVLTPNAPLEELGIDSLGVAELLFNIEDEFSVILPPESANLTTLGDVVAYIEALIQSQHGQSIAPDQGRIETVNGTLTASS
jgi:acyl carrier protein